MEKDNKPTVVVSRCLGFSNCRYNGDIINDKFVEMLKEYVNYITVCPEVDIGLGVPRNALRLTLEKEKVDLYQPASNEVFTKEIEDYSTSFFQSLDEVHGFILKGRSPSCGIKDVRVYLGKEKAVGSVKGVGIFASKVIDSYPYLAIEEEGRLTNYFLREHFLTKLFTLFRFQLVSDSNSMKELVKFHSENKYLFLSYNQSELKILGKIVANHDNRLLKDLVNDYRDHLGLLLAKPPRKGNYMNSFMHIFGYFSEYLRKEEKDFILERFDKYNNDKIHIGVITNLLKSYAIRYEKEYILNQSIFSTYPEELHYISDSGK